MRVTRPAVEYLSRLEKAKRWIFANIPRRRLRAKPLLALAARRPAQTPKNRESIAMSTISRPVRYT